MNKPPAPEISPQDAASRVDSIRAKLGAEFRRLALLDRTLWAAGMLTLAAYTVAAWLMLLAC